MKKIIAGTILFAALGTAAIFGAEDNLTLIIDSEELVCEVAPQIIDGRTMVPVRAIFETVGAEVSWDGETKTVTGVKGDTTVIMTVDSRIEEINGEETEMDVAPVIIDGRTLAPARYVAEAFGCTVEWNGTTKTVSIATADETETETETETSTETGSDFDLSFFFENDFDIEPIDYSSMDLESVTLHTERRYNFEQFYLYYELTVNKEIVAKYLNEQDYESFCNAIFRFWDANMVSYAMKTLENEGKEVTDETIDEILNDVLERCHLYGSENMGLILQPVNEDSIMLLIQMADDDYLPSCVYIAIVFDKEGNFKYYTLEKSLDDYYAVCEVTESSSDSGFNTSNSVIMTFNDDEADLKATFLYAVSEQYRSEE
ncbi:MAG: copper amine oxidase N-terminal domain-containing protein [Clostridiales bacterium]|nr:copper amine oxidase N-terminal domain-containing protein [Clostridiales bacterium]